MFNIFVDTITSYMNDVIVETIGTISENIIIFDVTFLAM